MTQIENPLGIAPFDAAEYLTNEDVIAAFLNESMAMNDPAVMLNAINTIARARGMSQLAQAAGLGRENLYNALKPGAKPRFETVVKLMDALGLRFVAQPKIGLHVSEPPARYRTSGSGDGAPATKPTRSPRTRKPAVPKRSRSNRA